MSASIEVERIGLITIAITDLDKSVQFYCEILGLELLFEIASGLAFLNRGGTRLMLTILQGKVKNHKTSVIYYKVNDIHASTERLKDKGVEFEREPQMAAKIEDHDLWFGFLGDPDNNVIGLMAEIPF
ncbi:VOC family protein [Shewanella sp.]|uniref:VOC family protein n=1 Tax=Shewanella sp. TaxID=50422 RepID=UPI001EB6C9AC|nr:VOC family protein [Shewanella sp.]NRB24596.1 VOC family protein [Shewanella sp.]